MVICYNHEQPGICVPPHISVYPSNGKIRIHTEQDLQKANQPFTVGVQKAEIASSPKTLG